MNEYGCMSNEELLKEYKMLDQLIHGKFPCYGVKDVKRLNEIEHEMTKREEG